MPGCVLRASGKNFDVDRFLEKGVFDPCVVYRKGERRSQRSRKRNRTSGFNVLVSAASGRRFQQQSKDALAFLKTHARELKRLVRHPGVEAVMIDFGITLKFKQDAPVFQFIHLPVELLQEASKLKIAIELSLYPA